jgi:hypothetical protein
MLTASLIQVDDTSGYVRLKRSGFHAVFKVAALRG